MAMLAALSAVNLNEKIVCIHVEHALRPVEESLGDAGFVRDFCKDNGIECIVKHITPGKISAYARREGTGIEAAARFFRHKALRRQALLMGTNTRILIAHTKDDMLETVLMRVLRGCGPAGLSTMPVNSGRILRPLLSATRADVTEYLKAKNILWREDSTNTDEKYLRNKIRRKLIPLLNESFPSWITGISAVAETQSHISDFIVKEARSRVSWETVNKQRNFVTNKNNFFTQPLIVREEALFLAIDELLKGVKNARTVKRSVIRKFCTGTVNAADLGSVRVKLEAENITLSRIRKEYFERGSSNLIL